jgi:hypothetical protein
MGLGMGHRRKGSHVELIISHLGCHTQAHTQQGSPGALGISATFRGSIAIAFTVGPVYKESERDQALALAKARSWR